MDPMIKSRKNIIILLFPILFCPILLSAQTGTLDTTFNKSSSTPGKRLFTNLRGNIGGISVDRIGRIVAASFDTTDRSLHIMRLLPDGAIDNSFGTNGYKFIVSSFKHTINCIAIQSDNKIIVGGGKSSGSSASDMYVLRLNENGKEDSTILGSGFWTRSFSTANDDVNKIYVQKDGKIIVGGKASAGVSIARLNADGTLDNNFGSGNGYLSTNSIQNLGGIEVDDANNIYVAGDSVNYFTTIKLLSSGDKFVNFGNKGIAKFNSYLGVPVGIALQPTGKIVLAGSFSAYTFTAVRFNIDGQADTTFGNLSTGAASYSCYYSNMNGMLLQRDGKVFIGGIYPSTEYRLMGLTNKGKLDSTFALYGQGTFSGSPTSGRICSTPDGKVLLFGKESSAFYVYKALSTPVIHIIGRGFTFPRSGEKYSLKVPATWSASNVYSWSYSGTGAVFVYGSTGINVNIFFTENATSGKLRCLAKNASGVIIGFEEIEILINKNASAARQLAELQCTPGVSDCSSSYMDLFQLNKTRNITPGCSNNGYSDFTPSNYTDTLYIGGVYSAKLRVGGEGVRYVSMWIDYNNDGIFNSSDEYLGESSSDNSVVEINNLVFKNAIGYEGPKRLRVRCRAKAQFKPDESCSSYGDIGETEDYLVVIQQQGLLEAPQIITPNEDGKNDYFVIRGVDPSSNNKLIVFDRTGKVKYSKENYENNWNGIASDGEKLIPGTYYYLFTNDDEFLRGFLEIRY
jgi:gliding motility-associated-like protein/uncharacterized delta-60 repeat protein